MSAAMCRYVVQSVNVFAAYGLQSGNGDTPGSNNVSTVTATNNAVVLSKRSQYP
ncbi:MAG: hypothetical protein LBJ79_03705 [Endomicrobium sp.]|nr:hypothetical protein [Endomicrobium sp.]